MTRLFHVSLKVATLGVLGSMVVGKVASLRLSPIRVIHLPAGDPSSPRAELAVKMFCGISVA